MDKLETWAYLIDDEWSDYLEHEIDSPYQRYGQLCLPNNCYKPSYWSKNIWYQPWLIRFDSIKGAADQLRSIQRNWALSPSTLHRRATLIQEKLPFINDKAKVYPFDLPTSPIGNWTLIDEHTLIASGQCQSPFAAGRLELEENKIDPPSSAYQKLREAFIRLRRFPQPGQSCIDLGASPGGWTWLLLDHGANVLAVDRSPLDQRLMLNGALQFQKGNAFALQPDSFESVDWLCSDLICYPERLWQWVDPWLQSGKVKNFVLTLKMQGEPDWHTMERFASIKDSLLYHGSYNKHELTWVYPFQAIEPHAII